VSKRETSTRQRRALIVKAAAECFIKKGFHQASVRDIARAAGISLGNLYNHFAGKDELIAEFAVAEANEISALAEKIGRQSDPGSALQCFVFEYLDVARDPANAALTVELTAEALRNPDIARQFSANRQSLRDLVGTILESGRTDGTFSAANPVEAEADIILDMIDGLALRSAFSHDDLAQARRRMLVAAVEKIVSVP